MTSSPTIVVLGPPTFTMKAWSRRFAEQLVRDNAENKKFDVKLFSRTHIDEIAACLRELGCRTEIEPFTPRIWVDCTQDHKS